MSININMVAIPGPKLFQKNIFLIRVVIMKRKLMLVNINANKPAKLGILVVFLMIVFRASLHNLKDYMMKYPFFSQHENILLT